MIKFEYNAHSPYDGFLSDKVTFEFDNYNTPAYEVFERWVRFMNAIGYNLDPTEMEAMWNGERYDEESRN
jgi:hypothetical protein